MADTKVFTWKELEQHSSRKDIWLAIDGRVYDVTKFLDEHPGGEEVLLELGGQDATEAFEEIGHSDDARALLKKWYIGNLDPEGRPAKKSKAHVTPSAMPTPKQDTASILRLIIPILIIVVFIYYKLNEQ